MLTPTNLIHKELEHFRNASQTVGCFDRLAAWQQGGQGSQAITRSHYAQT
jgi:hypothetical protein